jgi:peptidoglycan/LPS O-acetylase OafA/YrhL
MTLDQRPVVAVEAPPTVGIQAPAKAGPAAVQLDSLTGLRWLAAFLVFAFHISTHGYFSGSAQSVVSYLCGSGEVGVSFFFILSGFVLARTVRPDDTPARFWRRRIARIYPAHLVTAVAGLLIAAFWLPGLHVAGPREIVANVALVNAWWPQWNHGLNPVSWTLACEAFFYAVFPVLYTVLRRCRSAGLLAVAAGCAATVMVTPWLGDLAGSTMNLGFRPWARLPEFVLGVALGVLTVHFGVHSVRWVRLRTATGVSVAGYLISRQLDDRHGYAACTVIGFALLIYAAAQRDLSGARSWLSSRPMVRLGELSYGFYLVHLLVLLAIYDELLGGTPPAWALAAVAVSFGVALGLSWLLYEIVEVPGRRLISTGRLQGGRR